MIFIDSNFLIILEVGVEGNLPSLSFGEGRVGVLDLSFVDVEPSSLFSARIVHEEHNAPPRERGL